MPLIEGNWSIWELKWLIESNDSRQSESVKTPLIKSSICTNVEFQRLSHDYYTVYCILKIHQVFCATRLRLVYSIFLIYSDWNFYCTPADDRCGRRDRDVKTIWKLFSECSYGNPHVINCLYTRSSYFSSYLNSSYTQICFTPKIQHVMCVYVWLLEYDTDVRNIGW